MNLWEQWTYLWHTFYAVHSRPRADSDRWSSGAAQLREETAEQLFLTCTIQSPTLNNIYLLLKYFKQYQSPVEKSERGPYKFSQLRQWHLETRLKKVSGEHFWMSFSGTVTLLLASTTTYEAEMEGNFYRTRLWHTNSLKLTLRLVRCWERLDVHADKARDVHTEFNSALLVWMLTDKNRNGALHSGSSGIRKRQLETNDVRH